MPQRNSLSRDRRERNPTTVTETSKNKKTKKTTTTKNKNKKKNNPTLTSLQRVFACGGMNRMGRNRIILPKAE